MKRSGFLEITPAGFVVLIVTVVLCSLCSEIRLGVADEVAVADDPLPEGALIRLGTSRWRHVSDVTQTVFSPDGKILASAGRSEVIRLWDVATGRQIHELNEGGRWDLHGFAFSPDGQRLVSMQQRGKLRLWDVATGKQVCEAQEHPGEAYEQYAIALSADGKQIGTIGNKEIRLWNSSSLELMKIIPVEGVRQSLPVSITFSPDGSLLAASFGPDVLLWGIGRAELLRRITDAHLNGVKTIVFTSDSKTLISGGNGQVRDLRIGNQAGGTMAEIKTWVVDEGTLQGEFIANSFDSGVSRIFLDKSEKKLYSAHDTEIRIWDMEEFKLTGVIRDEHWGKGSFVDRSVSLSPDGALLADRFDECSVGLWDILEGKPVRQIEGHCGRVTSAIVTKDGKTAITGNRKGEILSWDLDSARLRGPVEWNHSFSNYLPVMTISPDGTRLAVGGGSRLLAGPDNLEFHGQLAIVRLDDRREEFTSKFDDVIGALAYSPDENVIAVASRNHLSHRPPNPGEADEGLLLIDADTGGLIRRISRKPQEVVLLEYSSDGKSLLLITTKGMLEEWDLESETLVRSKEIEWYDDKLWIGRARFSPDHKLLVSCGLFGDALVISDVQSGKLLRKSNIPGTLGNILAVSPDGKWIASACQMITYTDKTFDERIHLWEFETGKDLAVLDASSDGTVSVLEFLPDGKRLVSGMDRGSALIWDLGSLKHKSPE